ncbi:hypothetical protein COHA_009054 [Chlorella ohadii]|uniref:Uncharacterized protein n=1 Tax=Chlorella ohadii TaxID=2649997 RepID=A0AAD5DJ34_9CHLO|nr:hypothetical protein COHA_009054 [Chlorella ohadii]
MSRIYSAGQYESGYRPTALGNWGAQAKSVDKTGSAAAGAKSGGVGKTAEGRTVPIVNERGHIVAGGKKPKSAFLTAPVQQSPPRWPQPNPTIKGTAAATMGFKGIQTDYLPSSTVPLKTVEGIPGCKEGVNYAGGPH